MHNTKTMRKILTIILTALTAAGTQAAVTGNETVRAITPYVYPANSAQAPRPMAYMPDGVNYAQITEDGRRIALYDIKSGKETGTLVDLDRTREVTIPDIEGFILSPDGKRVIMYRDRQMIYRRSYTAQYYVYEVRTRLLDRLSPTFDRARDVLWSPDGRMIAFVAPDNNIYLKKLDYNNQVPVTNDGAIGSIINGATDWTYEEEFITTSLMAWSPDNLMLCFVKSNETDVPSYSLPLYEGTCNPYPQYAQYPGSLTYKYPVAGQTNSTVTLNSYDVETRKTVPVALPDKNIEYIPRIDYGPDPDKLMVSALNRDQNRFELFSVNPRSTVARSLLIETSKTWIRPETYEDLHFDATGFTVMSPRTGYMHLYRYSYTGQLTRTLTSGDYDVTAYYGADAAGNHYYQAARPTPMERTVYRLDAKNRVTGLAQGNGTHSATFSPGCTFAVMRYSDPQTPPQYTLTDNSGRKLRVLEDNAKLRAHAAPLLLPKEFIQIPSDGNQLNAYIIRPADFNASRKYPVIMYQYSGPGSQEVLNAWSLDWQYYMAAQGYIVVCVDPRGTGGRGSAFMDCVYKDLGHYETIDQVNAARHIATLPGVDPDRIGITGWSYGGYETLMCATDKACPWRAAVAIAPVTDWRYYDTVYAERYMLTPQQNEAGYNTSAPLGRVNNLACDLLIMYGTADDNVHPANSLQFVSALQSAGGLCDMFVFPNMNHSINGCNARAVVYAKMAQYFSLKLK